ncbi:unnamed protein product [Cylindrotheca closterium]|uniref:Uncharacterized protein n=1 Tax=Cylindrotheca closterium TaxID=2856 RepID=A0AAD2FRI4_9STRA|nr:unnamed protein product [Cylindrotheca closterium]
MTCTHLGNRERLARIGHNSCNCDNCCRCLRIDQEEVYIPDNSCNELETDSNTPQCCSGENTKGSFDTTTPTTVTPTPPSNAAGGSGGDSGPTFNLQDYTVPAPVCAITGDDNVQCDFTGIVPATGKLAYSITDFETCEGDAARATDISIAGTATTTATAGADTVTIDLTTSFSLADGASENFVFCLLTSLSDKNGNEMFYQGQKIVATFAANGAFTVSNIASEKFEGINDQINNNEKTFGVTATRCDVDRTPITGSALAVGTTLFICIDSTDNSTVISSVDSFGAKKGTNVSVTDLLLGNTEIQGLGTAAVIIGTRPFARFFADTTALDISGSVTLDVTDNGTTRRRLLARILQSGETDEFELQVELEAVEESSATGSGVGTAAVACWAPLLLLLLRCSNYIHEEYGPIVFRYQYNLQQEMSKLVPCAALSNYNIDENQEWILL